MEACRSDRTWKRRETSEAMASTLASESLLRRPVMKDIYEPKVYNKWGNHHELMMENQNFKDIRVILKFSLRELRLNPEKLKPAFQFSETKAEMNSRCANAA